MSKFLLHGWVMLLLIAGLSACSLVPNELNTAEQLIETAPDSALHILRHLAPSNYKSDENKARYGLLLMRVLDKNLLPLQPDSLLDFSVSYYENHSDKQLLATAYYLKGRAFIKKLQYEQATVFFLKTLDVLEGSDNYVLTGKSYNMLGEIYIVQRDYVTSREKYSKAYDCFRKAGKTNYAFYALLDIGRTYSQSKQIGKAQQCFERAYKFSKDSLSKGAALQEMATTFLSVKQYDSALFYFQKTLKYPAIGYNRAIQYYNLADIYFERKQIDSALYFAQQALHTQADIRIKKECYRILVNASSESGDMAAIKKYMICYQDCSDSIKLIDTQTRGSVLETIHNSNKEVSKSKLWVWMLLISLVLIAAGSVWLVIRVRSRKDRALAETKRQHQAEKGSFQQDILRKHRETLLHKLEKKKAALSVRRRNMSSAERNESDRKIYNEILHYDDKAHFFRQMDAVSCNLISKLRERYKGLTERELCWVCLHLLTIPPSDILLLLDYKHEALKKMKVRLIKKLNLAYVSMIPDFLQKTMMED